VCQGGGESADDLPARFTQRPEPGKVDMGVPDGADLEGGVAVAFGKDGCKHLARPDNCLI